VEPGFPKFQPEFKKLSANIKSIIFNSISRRKKSHLGFYRVRRHHRRRRRRLRRPNRRRRRKWSSPSAARCAVAVAGPAGRELGVAGLAVPLCHQPGPNHPCAGCDSVGTCVHPQVLLLVRSKPRRRPLPVAPEYAPTAAGTLV
jgi:hypothetical protein